MHDFSSTGRCKFLGDSAAKLLKPVIGFGMRFQKWIMYYLCVQCSMLDYLRSLSCDKVLFHGLHLKVIRTCEG